MSDEINERKPSISPGTTADDGLLSPGVGRSHVNGGTDAHGVPGKKGIIHNLMSSAAVGIVFCAQIGGAQYPMGFIHDLGLLLVSTQIGVRLKFPHDSSVCALDYGHIGGGVNLQNLLVDDIGGGAFSLAAPARPCSGEVGGSSPATPRADTQRRS